MIGVDWGTSSLRAFLMDDEGRVRDRREADHGIMHIEGGRFAAALREIAGDWIAGGATPPTPSLSWRILQERADHERALARQRTTPTESQED